MVVVARGTWPIVHPEHASVFFHDTTFVRFQQSGGYCNWRLGISGSGLLLLGGV